MTAVFVHGNPETAAIWRPMLEHLESAEEDSAEKDSAENDSVEQGSADTICLSPPGFGSPVPAGWGAQPGVEYLDWLTGELESIGEPVDLVGHDWGGGHVLGVALTRSPI